MKRCRGWMLAAAVLMALLFPATALAGTHEDVDDWDKLQAAFADADPDVTIVLTGDIEALAALQAKVGQTYVIQGQRYTLTNLCLQGEGTVQVDANLAGDGQAALDAAGSVTVQVEGDINSNNIGITATDSATVQATGDVVAEDIGVSAQGESNVVVTGDIDAVGVGIAVENQASVQITGNVEGDMTGANVMQQGKLEVEGHIAGTGEEAAAVVAMDDAQVHVTGDVKGGDGNPDGVDENDPHGYSYGGHGVYANGNATVTVDGDATGGDGEGTAGMGGRGVHVLDHATVTVGGDVQGGDVHAKAETQGDPLDPSMAGTGIQMDSTSTVTVGGNVKGGDTSADGGLAGQGVLILGLVANDPNATPGKLTIQGEVTGGASLLENGRDGNGIHLGAVNADHDYYLDSLPEAMDAQNTLLVLLELVEEVGVNYIGLSDEEVEAQVSGLWNDMTPVLDAIVGHPYDLDSRDDAAALLRVQGQALADYKQALIPIYNRYLKNMLDDFASTDPFLLPDITVYRVQGNGDAGTFGSTVGEDFASALCAQVNYTIPIPTLQHGALTADVATAKAGETVTLKAIPDQGYAVGVVMLGETVLTAVDGAYRFIMPEGGGVRLTAEFREAVKSVPEPDPGTGSRPETGCTAPCTGDDSGLPGWWAAVMAVSMMGCAAAGLYRRQATKK